MKNITIFKVIIALAIISLCEVGLTVFLAHRFGAKLTYSAFLITTFIGLVIDWSRWPKFKKNLKIFKSYIKNASTSKEEFYKNIPLEYFNSMVEVCSYIISLILFLIPGFITDGLGFMLLLPYTRNHIKTKFSESSRKKSYPSA